MHLLRTLHPMLHCVCMHVGVMVCVCQNKETTYLLISLCLQTAGRGWSNDDEWCSEFTLFHDGRELWHGHSQLSEWSQEGVIIPDWYVMHFHLTTLYARCGLALHVLIHYHSAGMCHCTQCSTSWLMNHFSGFQQVRENSKSQWIWLVRESQGSRKSGQIKISVMLLLRLRWRNV